MPNKNLKKDAEKFKKAIDALGIMQIEAAILLDRTPQTVNNYCKARSPIHPSVWTQLANLKAHSPAQLKAMAEKKAA